MKGSVSIYGTKVDMHIVKSNSCTFNSRFWQLKVQNQDYEDKGRNIIIHSGDVDFFVLKYSYSLVLRETSKKEVYLILGKKVMIIDMASPARRA
jgi:hypothetical protein